jgi:alanine dehydrogenase
LQFGSKINTVFSMIDCVEDNVRDADLVIGAVLIPGASAPRLLTKHMLSIMRPGSVVIDVSIDQGGCFETSKPTTHANPTYVVDGVVHYCVANMPAAVPLTSTVALNNSTLPFVVLLASQGYKEAMRRDKHLLNGLNICNGKITYKAVAEALHQPYTPAKQIIEE